MTLLSLLLLSGCEPTAGDDSSAPDDTSGDADTDTDTDSDSDADGDSDSDTDTDSDADKTFVLAIATVASDYSVGALAAYDLSTSTLTDSIATLNSDPAVVGSGSSLWVLQRGSENTVRGYTKDDLTTPTIEISTGDGTNPVDATVCNNKLFVALYDEGNVGIFDTGTGIRVGTVDLAAFDDGDGSGNPESLFKAPNGYLYVALNRFSYTTFRSEGGAIAKVDCASASVVASWDVGPNAHFTKHYDATDKTILLTGNFYDEDYAADLDGAIQEFDSTTDTLGDPVLTEATLGRNVSGLYGRGSTGILVADDGYEWSVYCVDFTDWSTSLASEPHAFIGAGALTGDGTVWLGYREGFLGAPMTPGVYGWHAGGCTVNAPLTPALPPYSLAALQ